MISQITYERKLSATIHLHTMQRAAFGRSFYLICSTASCRLLTPSLPTKIKQRSLFYFRIIRHSIPKIIIEADIVNNYNLK